jgi:glycosyltransferase involved in cell wall biosynthesis
MGSTGSLADAVIVNSEATAQALRPFLAGRDPAPPVLVAPLGIGDAPAGAPPAPAGPERPYFVTLGTIEPRKNHLLLLHLWRDLAALQGPAAPRLVIVGKRGWENENVVDILERCTALEGLVEEAGQLPDSAVTALVRGARALLFPSFAEGYGLPLAEALALRVPAICSDLPALHEVGGAVPDYLDPLDGAAWRNAVMDYARPASGRRGAQLARMQGWQPPSWERHFSQVDRLLSDLAEPRRSTAPQPRPAPEMVREPAAALRPAAFSAGRVAAPQGAVS